MSSDIESVILQSKLYNCLPSRIIGINEFEDSYTAFCFNEACAYIRVKIEEGKKPRYKDKEKRQNKVVVKNYKSFKEFYKQYE